MIIIEKGELNDIDEILKLNKKYLLERLDLLVQPNGFIKIKYNFEQIELVIKNNEIIVAKWNDRIIGYYLVGSKSLNPSLNYQKTKAMQLATEWNINLENIGFGCQVCIEEQHRNRGVSRMMFLKLIELVNDKYLFLLSSISEKNVISKSSAMSLGWTILDIQQEPQFYIYKIV